MEKLLIFGAGGFVGSYLAFEFKNAGYGVYGTDKAGRGALPSFVRFFSADMLDYNKVEALIKEVVPDVIINLAAVSSVGASWNIPQATVHVNVVGALNILESVRKTRSAARILFVGSSEEYAQSDRPIDEVTPLDANNPYGISKVAQEQFARIYRSRYGMKIYCVRSFNHTGPGQKDSFVLPSFCMQVAAIEKSGMPGRVRVGNLSAERDFADVRDMVRAYRMIVESDDCSEVYNVGSGRSHTLREMLDYIISLSGQDITVEVDPVRFRPVDTPKICCDNRRIREKLGWVPEHDIFETLKEMYGIYLMGEASGK